MATAFNGDTYLSHGQPITQPYASDITVPFLFYTGGTARAGQPGDATHTQLLTSGLFVVNDTVNLVKLPKGAVILDIYLDMPDVDSSTSSTTDLGLAGGGTKSDGTTVSAALTAFLSASTVGQAGGADFVCSLNGFQKQSLPYTELAADDILVLKAHAAGAGAGTATAGTAIVGYVRYHMRSTVF